jgi:hypothetical protein
MLRKFAKRFQRWWGSPQPRTRGRQRRLLVEALESRKLLAVTLTVNVSVTGIPASLPTTGPVPVIDAAVEIDYTVGVTQCSQCKVTALSGGVASATFTIGTLSAGNPFSVTVFSAGYYLRDGAGPGRFAVHDPSVTTGAPVPQNPGIYVPGDPVPYTYAPTGALSVTGPAMTVPVAINYATNPDAASAFLVLSELSIPINYASTLGTCSLPTYFVVDYPYAGKATHFEEPSKTNPTPTIYI